MIDTRTQILKDAVERLGDHGFRAKLAVIDGNLTLIAELTRAIFNDGQPIEVFHVGVATTGFVLRGSLDDAIDRYYDRMHAGKSASEIPAIDVYHRSLDAEAAA